MTAGAITPVAFVDEGLGNSSYLLDLGDGRALVVDPARDATPYLAAAERAGSSIAFTVETHLHADFLTGGRELAARGAAVLASKAAGIEWPHRGFDHGDELDLGGLHLQAVATPGHTPEHLSWLLRDGQRPIALFSGGALLVDAVARTDLIAPDQTEPLARALWRSLHERILTLPDDCRGLSDARCRIVLRGTGQRPAHHNHRPRAGRQPAAGIARRGHVRRATARRLRQLSAVLPALARTQPSRP